jgi:FMN-dependent NADH-azoreductase
VLFAPGAEFGEDGFEGFAVVGSLVDDGNGGGWVDLAGDEVVFFEVFEFFGQDFRGDAGDFVLDFVKAFGRLDEAEDDGEFPFAVDDVEGVKDVAQGAVAFGFAGKWFIFNDFHVCKDRDLPGCKRFPLGKYSLFASSLPELWGMKKILYLKSSLQGEASYSSKLGNAIIEKIVAKYPGSSVDELDLVKINIPHLMPEVLGAMFAPEPTAGAELSNQLVKQLFDADIIVIGAPLINFTIHSALKAWIDHITRAGITFGYGENGPIGKVTGKKVYIAMSSGGVYSEGPGVVNDFVAPYLKAFLGFLGMTDLTVFRAEGLKVPGVKETAMEKAIASIVID